MKPTAVSLPPAAALTDDPSSSHSDPSPATFSVERRGDASASCLWTLPNFPRTGVRDFYSRYFEVGGFDCRLLLYPRGDANAPPGYLSLYLQVLDPKTPSSSTTTTSSSKWDCFLSYRLSIVHPSDNSKSMARDSCHRFSSKECAHGWADFAPSTTGSFLSPPHDSLVITADISVLSETFAEADGCFTWKISNFDLFREMIHTRKITSPAFFPAAAGGTDCGLRISIFQSNVSGVDHLSVFLEGEEPVVQATSDSLASSAESGVPDESGCWCLFRVSILSHNPVGNHIHKDSCGRFGANSASLGWVDYLKMDEFLAADGGYLFDGAVLFISASIHVIKESNSFTPNLPLVAGVSAAGGGQYGTRNADGHFGKFVWRIENFTRLMELLKKRKIMGLCMKSRWFQVGNWDCRLVVYPLGNSEPPCNLSVFLEVTDPQNTSSEWTCFVSHRLSVINQKVEEKSIMKESQNRYSKSAKHWGWCEFLTLTRLFDQDAGFLVQDTVVFSAEIFILKETATVQQNYTIPQQREDFGWWSLISWMGPARSYVPWGKNRAAMDWWMDRCSGAPATSGITNAYIEESVPQVFSSVLQQISIPRSSASQTIKGHQLFPSLKLNTTMTSSYAGFEDRISTLPDGLILHIMSFLPATDVVRTCVLSQRWQYLWESAPCLQIHASGFQDKKSFTNFMNNLMMARGVKPLCSFKFRASRSLHQIDLSDLEVWLFAFLSMDLKELNLELEYKEDIHLSPLLFSINSLKKLHFSQMILDGDLMIEILSECNMLEELCLSHCRLVDNKLSSKSLKRLSLTCLDLSATSSVKFEAILIEMPSLLHLHLDSIGSKAPILQNITSLQAASIVLDEYSVVDNCSIIKSLSGTRQLEILAPAVGTLQIILGIDLAQCSAFSNLETLHLDDWCLGINGDALLTFLVHSPMLQHISIILKRLTVSPEAFKPLEIQFHSKNLQSVRIKFKKADARICKLLKLLHDFGPFMEEITQIKLQTVPVTCGVDALYEAKLTRKPVT